MTQLLDRLDDRFALLTAGTGWRRAGSGRWRPRWSGVTSCWMSSERRVFRAVSVFPAGFTLEAAEAVAGPGAGPAVLHLVDCSLLVPPRAGPDGRSRYAMLETLRAYGAGLLAEAGEQERRGRAGRVRAAGGGAGRGGAADQCRGSWRPRAGWMPRTPPCAQVLAWAMEHDPALALRLAAALGWWWVLRGRLAGRVPAAARGRRTAPSRAATGGAPRSSGSAGRRCSPPIWPGRWAISPRSATRSRTGRRPGRWPTALAGRSAALRRWAGSPRRSATPAARWPWPGSSATRSGR